MAKQHLSCALSFRRWSACCACTWRRYSQNPPPLAASSAAVSAPRLRLALTTVARVLPPERLDGAGNDTIVGAYQIFLHLGA